MNKNRIKAFVFDYGGTLDTGGCHWGKMLWHAYERASVPVTESRFREAYVYAERLLATHPLIHPDFSFYQTLDVKLRIEMEWLDCMTFHDEVLTNVYEQVKQYTAQSRDVLQKLRNHFPMALVSNFYGNISVVLKEFGLAGLFDYVIESAKVGVRKPDPRIFSLGIGTLGVLPENVAVVGDNIEKDIFPAKSLGCHTIWLRGEQWQEGLADETIPDCVIGSIKELEKIYETNEC